MKRKLLERPLVRAVLKSVPFVGDVVSNLDNEAPVGQFDTKEAWYTTIRYVIIAALLYLVISGKISWEEAEQAKEFLGN